ncbi:MAG: AEC family transporter [Ruminococcaceae bacterium]|nr:AEC family transporter [Oscillospiraceae bacterium]
MELFLGNALVAAKQVLILYIMVAVGFICDKTGLFTEKTARGTNSLLFFVTTPAVIIQSFLKTEFSKDGAIKLLIAFGGAVAIHLIGIAISSFLFKKTEIDKRVVYRFACVYGNVGYMALPLAQEILGSEGVFYCSVGVIAFNIFCFTHGSFIMTKKEKGEKSFKFKKLVLNPGVISVLIGLPLFLFSVKLPEIIETPLYSVAACNTPLAMIVFGTYLANADFKSVFKDKNIFLTAFVKLICMPLIIFGVYRLFGFSGAFLVAAMITASAPSANNTVIFTAQYDRDLNTASRTVTAVSVLSVITMPLIIALAQQMK